MREGAGWIPQNTDNGGENKNTEVFFSKAVNQIPL